MTFYAYRIKSLRSHGHAIGGEIADVIEHFLITGLFRFPNMRSLDITFNKESSKILRYLRTLVSPRILSLTVHCPWDEDGFAPKQDNLLQALVESLSRAAPNLRKLELSIRMSQMNEPWKVIYSLKCAILGLSRTLSTLTLTNIFLTSSCMKEILSGSNQLTSLSVTDFMIGDVVPTQAIEHRISSNIQDISLKSNAHSNVVNFLNTFHFPKLDKIEVHTEEPQSVLSSFGQALLESGCAASLTSVKIIWEADYPALFERVAIKMHSLSPFLQFPHIKIFAIEATKNHNVFFDDLNHTFLYQIARSWPQLEHLQLASTSPWSIGWTPKIKLADVLNLVSIVPSLHTLHVDIDFETDIGRAFHDTLVLAEGAKESVLFLHVGYATALHQTFIAAILSGNVRSIYVESSWGPADRHGEAWHNIYSGILLIRMIRLAERAFRIDYGPM
jgi:hypothetical protein